MGQISAKSSMERVLIKHRKELVKELKSQYPSKLVKTYGIGISDDCYGLTPVLVLTDGTEIELTEMDINSLKERFPDSEVGY